MTSVLHWFRVDLRVHDNTGLYHAAKAAKSAGGAVYGLFVVTPTDWARHDDAANKIDLMLRTLRELSGALGALNIPLLVRTAGHHREIPAVVAGVAAGVKALEVHANRQYELHEIARDERVAEALRGAGARLHLHHDQTAIDPGEIRTGEGKPYTVYTPFKKRWIATAVERGGIGGVSAGAGITVWPAPAKQAATGRVADAVPERVAGFEEHIDASHWPAGEAHAMGHLKAFVAKRAAAYKEQRDIPGVDATSRLSPYLAIGAVSPRQCLQVALEGNGGRFDAGQAGHIHWMSEVLWREFYKHLLVAFPRLSKGRAFKPATEAIVWSGNAAHFAAWQAGRTGFPIVDAACRQLLETGWMHNRLRMIAAMFLTKDLFIDWRWGERHFMRHLVDGDLSQNNGGWQWSASTGTDAAPYFRIFNPTIQSAKFDPEGAFIRRFVPELRGVPAEYIHEPHGEDVPMQVRLRLEYARPIVDRTKSKDRVVAAFRAIGEVVEDGK